MPAAAPGFQKNGPVIEEPEESCTIFFLQRALSETLPGLPVPLYSIGGGVREAAFIFLRGLTGVDLRDPCSFLDYELGGGAGIHLPVFLVFPDQPGPEENTASAARLGPKNPASGQPDSARPGFPFFPGGDPGVLLYHTHITESFVPDSQVVYTEDLDLTVARLGTELASLLEKQYGLSLLHHTGVYDLPRRTSYEKARPALEQILDEHPGLRLVVDLHRDGVAREVTTVTLDGVTYGKILLVVGTGYPDYQSNLSFSLHLHRELENLLPGLSRGVRQQPFIYNQDLCPYSILVEIGGHENSLAETALSLPFLAEALARTYYAFFLPAE